MKNNNENYTLLPNNLLQPTKDSKSLFQEYQNHKLLLAMDYLHVNTNRFGISIFTLEDMIKSYGFELDSHKGRINSQMRNMIEFLQFKGIVSEFEFDIQEVKPNQLLKCKYSGIKKNDKGKNIDFASVDYKAIKCILSHEDDSIDKVRLLFYYCYLCSRIYTPKGKDMDIRKNGGRANPCFPSYETITKDTTITDKTIKQYNDILVKLNLIRIGNPGVYYFATDKSKNRRESPNFYTHYTYQTSDMKDEDTIWFDNLKKAIEVYKNEHTNMVFTGSREYKDNNKSNAGFIGSINRLEKAGKATPEQIQKRDELKASKNYTEETITSIRNQIKDINDKLLEADKDEKYKDIQAEIEIYFEDTDKSINDIEDCKDILNMLKDMENKYLNEDKKHVGIKKKPKQLCEPEYDDNGNVLIESVLSKDELDAYYKEKFEQNGYWDETPSSVNF